ncbi:MAG: hypothetical protein FWF92_10035 [Oscillospiraceae bacterium]|nr:hypothetical protein [Oscillospiraceae bacterium]
MNKGYNQNNMNMPHETEEHMYPEVYKTFAPICDQMIKEMEHKYGNIYLSEELLNQMTDEAIRRSGMDDNYKNNMDPDPYSKKDGDAVQTIYEFGRHGGYGRDHWRRYDRGALSDIAGILFLNRIFGRRRPFWRWR